MKNSLLAPVAALIVVSSWVPALADSTTDAILRLEAKIDALAKDNAKLRTQLGLTERMRVAAIAPASRTATDASPPGQMPKAVYAASFPVKAAYAPPVPAYSWTGCYVGVHGGGGWQTSSLTSGVNVASGVGGLGGAQAGCNLQWRQFVIGIEGEFWGSSLYDRSHFGLDGDFQNARSRNLWDGAVSVRSGFAFDYAFVYGKLGLAIGKFDYTADFFFAPDDFGSTQSNALFTGVLIGVGFEYALTDHWTTKFEYNYIDFGTKIVGFDAIECFGGVCTTHFSTLSLKETKQLAKIGLNYKFNYADPIRTKN